MGRYTEKSRGWELLQSFLLFFFLVFLTLLTYGFFGPVVILIAAKRVDYVSWAKKAVILLAIHSCVLIGITIYEVKAGGIDLTLLKMIGSSYVFTIFMSFHLREYLERLDLKKYMRLEPNVSYSYRVVKKSIRELEEKELSEKEIFMQMLSTYREKIHSSEMKENLLEMENLAGLIVEKDKERSSLFFLKHHSGLDSVLKQYVELQDLTMVNVDQMIAKLIQVIEFSRRAFEKELMDMFDVEVLSNVSEADFYKNYVQSKGLI
ncbi:MAG: hypothetical protein LBI72_06115 [Flavobacteriaceae bacterium]|jgi:hypothetical protein|nr:hypothetical protein [Flavobacteriaceae bacterium]